MSNDVAVTAGMSYALILMGIVLFVSVLLWGILGPHVHDMLNYATSMSSSAKVDTGVERVRLAWDYWPLWGGGALLLYGYQRAVNESRRGL